MLKKAYNALTKFETVVMSALFIFLSFAIVVDVICRKFFATSFPWLEELSRYSFIVCTFMGASIAVTRDGHPKMTAIQELVPAKVRKIMEIVADTICMFIFAYVCYYGVLQTMNVARMGTMTTSLKIPLFIIFTIIPLATFGMVVRYGFRIADMLHKKPEGGENA